MNLFFRRRAQRHQASVRPSRTKLRRALLQSLESLEPRRLLTATPGPDPVLIVPGFASTFANITEPGLSQVEIDDRLDEWYTHRGLPPEKLVLEPHGQVYFNLVETLENVGYVQGESLFVVLGCPGCAG